MVSQSVADLIDDEKPMIEHRMIASFGQYFNDNFPIKLNQNICEVAVMMSNKDLDIESLLVMLEKDFSNPEYNEFISINFDGNPDSDEFVNHMQNLADNISIDISNNINNRALLYVDKFLSNDVAEICVCCNEKDCA